MHKFFLIAFLFLGQQALAQGFLMGHFFKPGLKVGVEYQPHQLLNDDASLDVGRARLGLSVPIKSKLGLAIKPSELKLENVFDRKKWKNIPNQLTKVFKPKMHQIFWNFNGYYNYLNSNPPLKPLTKPNDIPNREQHLLGGNTGITGFHYLRKARILFYSANVGFLEDKYSIKHVRPTANALVGFAQVTSLHSVIYIAAYAAYADKRVLPVPVIGFDTRLAKGLRLNITLPVQVKLTLKRKKNRFSAFVTLSGFLGGQGQPALVDERAAQTFSYLKSGLGYTRKIGKRSKLVLDAGWADWRRLSLKDASFERTYRPKGSPYVAATFYRTFGKSVFDGSMGNFLN